MKSRGAIYIFFSCLLTAGLHIFSIYAVSAQNSLAAVSSSSLISFSKDTIGNLVPDHDELRAGLLYDVKRNVIVWEKDMDYAYPIASLTKMMVGLLAIEDVESGKVQMTDTIVVERTYKKRIKRRKYRTYKVIESYTLYDMLKMAMIASHNESTVWIAKHCGGTLETFIERMNSRAVELGMTKTNYNNPSGLPASGSLADNSASSRDLLILALEILRHPQLMEITSMPYATANTGKGNLSLRNHNGLTINYTNEVDGIKTGYTRAAKFCLVATAQRAEHRLISIALGVRSPWVRNGIVAGMMNNYYDAVRLGRLGESNPDAVASSLFLDSVAKGLVAIVPNVEPKHQDTTDQSYAYTYTIKKERVKKSYTVRSGDNLSKIAEKFNCSVTDLKKWNKLRSTKVLKGQRLYTWTTVKRKIPVKLEIVPDEDIADADSCIDEVTTDNSNLKDTKPTADSVIGKGNQKTVLTKEDTLTKSQKKSDTSKPELPKIIYHKVQPGDTLWNIAQRYKTTIQEIKRANRINSNQIKIGAKLKVPVA